ncbi:hypothetical protein BAUCODRAFT_34915 [Baudoinia panamericana UAMH 10762]|uniref:very-long-chain enoyl-CoA reductase n=1 Tax=Baudoinia panamericana (strain UAMH 10762) TaxID=717646 RepID=M2MEA5_BAUPA|nr:uncharacterized protein BAUCODRAFT_34915 [Baudoinia panamericana UAMH 10762]EMC94911.1 hypothetical protein BAUCODRAFT_34915 [Baudoinia panamericana UAMH 10762]
MASKPVTLKLQSRGKRIPKLPSETNIYVQGSSADLYERIAKDTGYSVHRLRITSGEDGKPIPNDKKITVSGAGLGNGSVIQVKDLGPQIAWQTVFVIEYIGPLIIHPLFYFLRPYIYKNAPPQPSTLQTLSCAMITSHFLKRELETLFVHRFSHATMSANNIFKNSGHYWILGGFLIAYFTYGPNSITAKDTLPLLTYAGVALFLFGELANLNTHMVLRNLRSPGGTERGVPKGFGFDLVTCPNYLFEAIAWIGVLMVNRSWTTVVFIAVAVLFMARWAKTKEIRYRKELGSKYQKKRYAMVPGVY